MIFLAGLCIAAGIVFLSNYLLAGPRLGPHYDFFLNRRQPPVSGEILLVGTGENVDNSDMYTVLMTLTELDASDLIFLAQISGTSSPILGNEWEIRQRFNDEFNLIGNNISNLFEGIRTGSVRPLEAPGYVETLVELTRNGRDRLTSALIAGNEELDRLTRVFGHVWEAGDIKAAPEDSPWYVSPRLDRGGKLRRIAPVLMADTEGNNPLVVEHLVYRSLQSRWASSEIEFAEHGPVLAIHKKDGTELKIPLDKNGNILLDSSALQFKHIDIDSFREYEEADRNMRRLLKEAEDIGAFSKTRPERVPLYLHDHAVVLREELLNSPEQEVKAAWIAARDDYFLSLEDFLYGSAETTLVNGYEEIIAVENLNEENIARLVSLRDELIRCFAAMREKYLELAALRGFLSGEAAASYCIMGQVFAQSPADASALLANALLTGGHIIPGQNRYILFWSLGAVFFIMLIVHALRPAVMLTVGLIAAALCAAGFGWSFITSAYWIDPAIACVGCIFGIMFIFCVKTAIRRNGARNFRFAYSHVVSKPVMKELVRRGRPLLSETIIEHAAIIALKDPSMPGMEDKEEPAHAADTLAQFRAKVRDIFTNAGAVIISYEGGTVLACFGSPPQRIYSDRFDEEEISCNPALNAVRLVTELLRNSTINWHFGMDSGDCAFSWSPETGYTANGRAVVRARLLLSMTSRFQVRSIVADSVREYLNQPARKLGAMRQGDGGREYFYELK